MSLNGNHSEATRNTVELRIVARPENLALARLALVGVATNAGVSEDVTADLKLAVTEACTNAIQHAFGDSSQADEIVIRYTTGKRGLLVEVEDFGRGFEPENVTAGPHQGDENLGLGLMIIDQITDEMTISSGNSGSRVAFLKWFSREG